MILSIKSAGNENIDRALKRVEDARQELHSALRDLSGICENLEITFVHTVESAKPDADSGN